MVNIFPILVFLDVTAKKNTTKTEQQKNTGEPFLKPEDKRG